MRRARAAPARRPPSRAPPRGPRAPRPGSARASTRRDPRAARELPEPARSGLRARDIPARQAGIHERRDQLGRAHRVVPRLHQPALQQRRGHLRLVLRDTQEGQRAQRRRVLFAPGEQLLGLRQAALADAQLRHRGHGRRAHRRDVAGVRRERALQCALRVGPAASGQQDVGVDRAAGAEQGDRIGPAGEVVDHLAPLRGALPLAGAGAGRDQVAVGLAERVDVAHAFGRGGRHRLFEKPHPLLPAPGADLRPPEHAEGEDLEVGRVRLSRDSHRAPSKLDALLDALRVAGPLDRDPAMPGTGRDGFERALDAGQPAPGGRGSPRHRVLVRHPDPDARGLVASPGANVHLEGALARLDRRLHTAQEPQRLTQAAERFGRLLSGKRGLERGASLIPFRGLERAPALFEPVAAAP